MTKIKTTLVAAGLGLPVLALALATTTPASATIRRLTPTGYCQCAAACGNYEANLIGYIRGKGISHISCGIPNDSLLPTDTITKINVHIRSSSNTAYAQPCAYKYNDPSTWECDNYKSIGGTGNRTISFETALGELPYLTADASWGTSMYVRLGADDILSLLYVRD
jgi:hypothetical protein